jgi:hypothetical protein
MHCRILDAFAIIILCNLFHDHNVLLLSNDKDNIVLRSTVY